MNKRRFAAFAATALVVVGLLFGQGPVQKVRLWDTNLSHSLLLNWNEDRAAGYNLNWIGITADRTITLQGNPTLDDWFDQSVKTTFSPTFVTAKLSALTDGYVPYHVSDAAGLANSVIRTDGTLVGVGMLPTVAQLEVNTSQIITSTTAAPYLKIVNLSDTERDPIIQWAVGATPIVKWTMGVDDSDVDKFKLATGSLFGDDHDVLQVASWDGSTAGVTEFTLVDTWQTPIGGGGLVDDPRGICTDETHIYYSDYEHDQLVKLDPVTETEVLRVTGPAQPARMVTDGTYLYVIGRYTDKVLKYNCSDLVYVTQSAHLGNACGMCYWGGHLYVTDIATGVSGNIFKIRCSDMSTIWDADFSQGSGVDQFDKAVGIATDGAYLYVLDAALEGGANNRIVRLNIADGTWVDSVNLANTIDSYAIWIAGDWIYVGTDSGYIDKLLRSDLSLVERFPIAATDIRQAFRMGGYHYIASVDDTCIYKYDYVAEASFAASGFTFRLRDVYGQLRDVAKLTGAGDFGVGTDYPTEKIDAIGNIKASFGQFISTKATGVAPVVVSSTTVCTNLNAGLVDGYHHDQSLLIAASPTFVALNLSATSNQIVLQSAGVTGTITATPASSNKVWTLQNVTGTIYQTDGTDVAVADGGTNKSSWTLYAIPYASGTTTIGEIAIGTAGQVLAVDADADGYVWAAAGGAVALDDLTDVDVTSPSDDDIIRFDTASGLWKHEALPAAGNHDLLSATHGDTTAMAVTRGDIIIGSVAAPNTRWTALGKGTAGYVLTMGADEPTWAVPSGGGAPTAAKYIVQELHADLSAEQSLGALTTGLLLNTVTAGVGVLSKATAGTDYAAPCNHYDIHLAGATSGDGVDQDRTTGSSYTSQSATITLINPVYVTKIVWDLDGAATYTLTINGAQFGDAYIAGGDVADAEFIGTLMLMNGNHTIKLTRSSGATWFDKNASSYSGTLWSSTGITYGTTFFSSYTIPMKMTGNIGTWAVCGS